MDKTDERETQESLGDSLHDGATAEPAQPAAGSAVAAANDAAPVGSGDDPANFVTICAWCPQLHILKLQLRDVDVLIVYKQGKELRILRNGVNLKITHGICAPCRSRMR
jgi:hypothetical protein